MNKNEILSSAMADEMINKLNARKSDIAKDIEVRKADFEQSDVERRDAILDEVKNLEEEVKGIDSDLAELDEIRSKFEEQEKRMGLFETVSPEKIEGRKSQMENVDVRSTPEFVHAWREAVETGNEKNMRALLTTMNSGTAPVPTYLQGRVEAAWERLEILNEVTITNVKGIVAVPYEVSATGAAFHTEGTNAPAEEELEIGQTLLQPVMIKKWLRVSDETEAMTDEQFMDYVVDEIIYQVNLAAENAVVTRNAATGIVGITNADLAVTVSSALSFNAGNDGMAELMEVFNPTVIMNRKTFFKNIMALTDQVGRPIYQIATNNTGRAQYFVNGLRVKFNNSLPAYDDAAEDDAWAVVGDLKAYRLNLPDGRIPTVLYDPYTEAEKDLNKYVGRLLAAGDIVRPKAIAVLTKPGE